jgi:acyl-coenzyme A synthetase/AMP-(fatty) acid ligase
VRTSLGKLLEDRTKQSKKKIALIFGGGKEISSLQLNENVNKFANGLRNLGVEKGDRVAIMLPNIPETRGNRSSLQHHVQREGNHPHTQ